MAGSNNRWRPRPLALAAYMATSASRMSESAGAPAGAAGAPAAAGLGGVQGDVGAANERVGGGAGGADGDAAAGRDGQRAALHDHRVPQRIEQPSRRRLGLPRVFPGLLQEDGELVPAEPR